MTVDLKEYQERALERFDRWVGAVNEARDKSARQVQILKENGASYTVIRGVANYPKHVWDEMAAKSDVAKPSHKDRFDRAGRPIPHACIKIPTGGGKTLVAAAALERLGMRTGLVLWVVPNKQILGQTLAALRNRDHPIRRRLDRGSGGRTKILQKSDPFNAYDTEQHLCVMVFTLATANRRREDDYLRMNRNSGTYLSFFPDSDDASGNDRLKKHPGLEVEDGMVKHSLANVMRMKRPVVILDEAHKAYRSSGRAYSDTINKLNPRMVVEMSATPNPDISNLLVDVSGTDLWSEEMIKMPIDLNVQTDYDWKHMLDVVNDRRNRLEDDAESLRHNTPRYIRPIVVVRAERTGKTQRDGIRIHADDVKAYLTDKLGIPADHIAIHSSERKDLDGVKLMSESTPIRWIITKEALKEGWDCPFAYVLAILDNIATHTSVTQLLGRVLRQPDTSRTGVDSLDRCYVYCHRPNTGDAANHVRKGLGEIGMADMTHTIIPADQNGAAMTVRKRKREQGRVFLPQVLHRNGSGWRKLEYVRDILSGVDFGAVNAPDIANFSADPQGWRRQTVTLGDGPEMESEWNKHDGKSAGAADLAIPLSSVVPNVWQAARIAQDFMGRLRGLGRTESDIYDGLPYLTKVLRDHVAASVNMRAEKIFRDKLERGCIRFDLEIEGHGYLVEDYDVKEGNLLKRDDGSMVQLSLFDPTYREEFDTDMERSFARYLDGKDIVKWWHRMAADQGGGYHLVGWRRTRFYPDFIVMTNEAGDRARLGIYDTKGDHLADGGDAKYKEDLLKALEEAFDCGTVRVRGGRIRGEFRLVFEDRFEEILS